MKTSLFWFRQDLRLMDNPGFFEAVRGGKVLAIYIDDTTLSHEHRPGAASKWWLHQSLATLNEQLNGNLNLYQGDPHNIINDIIKRHNIKDVFWNRCYEPYRIAADSWIKTQLKLQNISVKSFNASFLWEPHSVLKNDGTPYKVFTPYYKNGCLKGHAVRSPLPKPDHIETIKDGPSLALEQLGLMPTIPWYKGMEKMWKPGEQGAHIRLQQFLEQGLTGYKEKRNVPSLTNVSRLSPHLHFGEISPHTVWHQTQTYCEHHPVPLNDLEHFQSELGWREFSAYLLYHFPSLPIKNFQSKFDNFPWNENDTLLTAWQQGKTGYPIIDAGMRELWQTGYMHNRVRMIVGSFLVKNLLQDWRKGASWFWDCLVDANLANNSASWQWIAGSGADAAPYFRIFNPITQGEKFDPEGTYIKAYIPELQKLPAKYISAPWTAPSNILSYAGVTLGTTYPHPIVDIAKSRQQALAAYHDLKLHGHKEEA